MCSPQQLCPGGDLRKALREDNSGRLLWYTRYAGSSLSAPGGLQLCSRTSCSSLTILLHKALPAKTYTWRGIGQEGMHKASYKPEPDSQAPAFCLRRRSSMDGGRQEGRGRKIALDIARGLAFLHQMQLIHFDVKSPNGEQVLRWAVIQHAYRALAP